MKRVNVKAIVPVYTAFTLPFIGEKKDVEVTEDQIYRCLVSGARVEEILPDGQTIKLDFTNYNKVNSLSPIKVEEVAQDVVVNTNDTTESEEVKDESTNDVLDSDKATEEKIETEEVTQEPVKEEVTLKVEPAGLNNHNNNYNKNKQRAQRR